MRAQMRKCVIACSAVHAAIRCDVATYSIAIHKYVFLSIEITMTYYGAHTLHSENIITLLVNCQRRRRRRHHHHKLPFERNTYEYYLYASKHQTAIDISFIFHRKRSQNIINNNFCDMRNERVRARALIERNLDRLAFVHP